MASFSLRTYLDDCGRIFRLGLPVLVSQVGMIVVGFADNIMVGHYSTAALASASLVNNLFNLPLMCAMGFSYGLTPLVGALFTGGDHHKIGRTVKAGLQVNMLVGLLIMSIMTAIYLLLPKMGQPAELLPIIRPYFLIMIAGILPICIFNVFAQWSYGIRNTALPMWIMLAANALNILGNYLLIFGHDGMPEMGLTGAGISTLFSRTFCAMVMMTIFLRQPEFRPYAIGFRQPLRPRERMRRKVAAISWPIALQMSFETAAFSGCAVMCGFLSVTDMAAFQIITIVGTLGFCFYYAMGTAVSVLVANEAGRGDLPAMRRKAMAGYGVILSICFCSSLLFALGSRPLMHLFTDDSAVLAAALSVVFPLILYQVADATQINFANALRGTGNVRPMMWIALVSYILVGLPASWILAFPLHLGLYGIVLSFTISLLLAALLFLTTFLRTLPAPRQ